MALSGSSYAQDFAKPKKPPQKKKSGMLDLLLVAGLVVVVLFLVVPSLRNRVARIFASKPSQTIATQVTVWASKDAGAYYCDGSRFYGHGSGSYMKQGDALTDGYQPAMGQYCKGSPAADSKDVNAKGIGSPR
jgi:hypothetical protein